MTDQRKKELRSVALRGIAGAFREFREEIEGIVKDNSEADRCGLCGRDRVDCKHSLPVESVKVLSAELDPHA
jgi:hypothetical protein